MSLFTPYTYTGQKAQLRYDPNAAQLRYATPGVMFPDLGMVSANDDISQIARAGVVQPMTAFSGSAPSPTNLVGTLYLSQSLLLTSSLTSGQPTSGSFQTNSSGSKWLNEGYRGAVATTGTNALLARVIPDIRLNLGASDWTMEFWVNPSTTTMRPFFNNYRSYQVATTQMGWFTGANTFSLYIESGANEYGLWVGRAFTVTINQWNHVAVTRSGDNYRCFINGVQQGTTVLRSGTINGGTTWPTYIGNYNNSAGTACTYQDARIYIGVAKYTANFTPPPNMVIAP